MDAQGAVAPWTTRDGRAGWPEQQDTTHHHAAGSDAANRTILRGATPTVSFVARQDAHFACTTANPEFNELERFSLGNARTSPGIPPRRKGGTWGGSAVVPTPPLELSYLSSSQFFGPGTCVLCSGVHMRRNSKAAKTYNCTHASSRYDKLCEGGRGVIPPARAQLVM